MHFKFNVFYWHDYFACNIAKKINTQKQRQKRENNNINKQNGASKY